MKPSSPFTRTLQLAAETLGGVAQLAARLGIDQAQLERWMAGEGPVPNDVFIEALDIVAAGQLGTNANATRAQAHADRMQASADRAQEAADRAQQRADELNPEAKTQHFRKVQRKNGDQASNTPEEKNKKA